MTTGKVAAAPSATCYVLDESTIDSFTWTLAVPAAGSYQLYARWVAASANSSAAQYTVTHAGGSSPVTVSQKQNGGQWHLLGTYNFAPDAGHKVRLAAAADGTVIADAILLVGAAAPPSNLLYVHADHLGTSQKLTDADQAIVWDGEFEPFGEEVAIAGTAELPLRFPGQYADTETGYSYNYFRDYDPTLGRFIESDPIGLMGGLNTYTYVEGNPLSAIDPSGLAQKPKPGTYRWRDCNNREMKACRERCEAEGKQYESCKVPQVIRVTRATGPVRLYAWKEGRPSCSCKEPFCQRNGAVCAAAGVALLGIGAVCILTPIPGDEVLAGAVGLSLLGVAAE